MCVMAMEDFERVHRAQLQSIGFPSVLLSRLFAKLAANDRDDGLDEVFQIMPTESEQAVCGKEVRCRQRLVAEGEVFVLRHVWSCDGGEGGRRALLADQALLEELAGSLGVAMPWERRKAAMERMTKTVCEVTGKSRIVARKALTESGYDLVAAVLQAKDPSNQTGLSEHDSPSLSQEEFRRGLSDLSSRGGEIPEGELTAMYEDWKYGKLREPERDKTDWVQCGRYKWKEEEEGTINVMISVPANTSKRNIKSEMTSRHWRLSVKGERELVVIDGDFLGRVVPDESFWTLDGTCVSVSVQSVKDEKWGELILGEVQGVGVAPEEMGECADEILLRMRKLNFTYSAVTENGIKCPLHLL